MAERPVVVAGGTPVLRLHTETLTVSTRGKSLTMVTDQVARVVSAARMTEGICTLLIRHTSASLVVQENADPSVQWDLERFFARLVPEDRSYEHSAEGPDDMPAHIRSALTQTSLSLPVLGGRLALGTWQGIYVWEHRSRSHSRQVVVQVLGH